MVLIKTVYYPYWWIVDIVTVIVHSVIVVLLTFPVIAVWFYMQLVESGYRMSDPRQNLVAGSFQYDFWQTPGKVLELHLAALIFIALAVVFIVINFFQEFIIYVNAVFPENRIFS